MADIKDELAESMKMSLKDLLRRLKEDRDKIESEIERVKRELVGLGETIPTAKGSQRRQRRPRGLNREAVKRALAENATRAITVTEIANAADIPASSVRAALHQLHEQNLAEELSKGIWKYREPTI